MENFIRANPIYLKRHTKNPNNTPDTENRNVFGIFLRKIKKFKKRVDICVVMVYNIATVKKARK